MRLRQLIAQTEAAGLMPVKIKASMRHIEVIVWRTGLLNM